MYKFREVRKLSTNQEICLLHTILNNRGYDRDEGSSRIVLLSFSSEIEDVLKDFGINTNCVIKINVGQAGCVQSEQERNVYESADDDQVKFLADIYAYGEVLQIMEKVEPYCVKSRCFREIFDCGSDHDCDGYVENSYADRIIQDFAKELAEEEEIPYENARRILDGMNEDFKEYLDTIFYLTGDTGDNYQIGISIDNKIKCYDYGFFEDSDREDCCFQGDPDCIYVSDYIDEILSAINVGCALSPTLLQDIAVDM